MRVEPVPVANLVPALVPVPALAPPGLPLNGRGPVCVAASANAARAATRRLALSCHMLSSAPWLTTDITSQAHHPPQPLNPTPAPALPCSPVGPRAPRSPGA